MNYYQALQRQSDKRWDYTSTNDKVSHPVGYCAGLRLWTEEKARGIIFYKGEALKMWIEEENAKLTKFEAKYHKDGHATQKEAENCYREYLLDYRLRFFWGKDLQKQPDTLHKCHVCEAYTANYVEISNWDQWYLCDAHSNRETVEGLFKAPSYAASSY